MQNIIDKIESYRQELLDYREKIQRGVEKSLPLIDATLEYLGKIGIEKCPFCSAPVYPFRKAIQVAEKGLEGVFDLPDTLAGGGFVNTLSWIYDQSEARYCGGETEWYCTNCYTGKLTKSPDEEAFRYHWDRENLPISKQAVAYRILERFPQVTEIAYSLQVWYILCNHKWYANIGGNEIFVEKWGIDSKQPPNNEPVPGHVYLLYCKGLYKIGKTTQKPEDRISQIDMAIPFETTLVHTISADDCTATEQRLHARFIDKQHKGEWYRLDEADVEYIKGLGAQDG